MSITDSLSYPMESDDWIMTVLVGGGLLIFSFLILPMFVVYGYVVRAIRTSSEGESTPPSFGNWVELLVDGFKAWVIAIVYMIVPLIVGGVTVGGSIVSAATGGEAGFAAAIAGASFGFALWAILSLVFGYLAVVAIVNFAREGRVGAAFDVGVIRSVAFDWEFALPWLASIVIFVVAGFITGIPILGWLLAPFLTFYVTVVAADLWAGGFAQARDSTAGVGRVGDEEPAV